MGELFVWLDIVMIAGVLLFIITGLPKIIYYFVGIFAKDKNPLPKAKNNHKFAVIIPARNESAVIEKLLVCLKDQTYSSEYFDVYVAVEREDDPTCEIAKGYGAEIYIKKNFEKNGKGYVLEEVVDHIFANRSDKNYEAFMIVDADNILSKDYMQRLNDALDAGYDIALGYRNSKNWNGGWIAACTGLTFTRFSRFQNFARNKFGASVLLSGTGYYIKTDIVKKFGGWKWHSLTEDVELTTVSALNNFRMCYIDDAVFYDEQPTDLKTSFNQRKRWVKGYMQNSSAYHKKIGKGVFDKNCNRLGCLEMKLGAACMACFAACFAFYLIVNFLVAVMNYHNSEVFALALSRFIGAWLGYFAVLYIDTAIMLFVERKRINMKPLNKLGAVIMRPVYSLLYFPVAIAAIMKDVEWVPIEHKINTLDEKRK